MFLADHTWPNTEGSACQVVWPQARESSSRGTLAPKDGRSRLGCSMVFLGS